MSHKIRQFLHLSGPDAFSFVYQSDYFIFDLEFLLARLRPAVTLFVQVKKPCRDVIMHILYESPLHRKCHVNYYLTCSLRPLSYPDNLPHLRIKQCIELW